MFKTLFDFVDKIVVGNISSMVGIFSSAITPLLGACVILYIVYMAYEALFDSQNLMVMESIKTIGSLAVVTTIALNTAWYLDNIVPSVLYIGDDISNVLLGSSGSSGSTSLQKIFDIMIVQTKDISASVDLGLSAELIANAFWSYTLIFLTWFGFVPFLIVSTAYLLVAKLMVGFLLIIGPMFIMMAFFPSMRAFFQSWTKECFNYILLNVIYPLAFSIFIQILQVTVLNENLSLTTLLMTVIIMLSLLLISVQIPAFCSMLSGGVGINSLVGQGISAAREATRMAGGAGSAAKGVKNGAKNAGGKLLNYMKGKIMPG
ncbi:TPA: type IV secretion system protein [Vibrio cholerae]|uniref:type IV secretion system protein n=1 Tax=Vibrio cholerae TaxID=666 RepID=UPI001A1B92F6|nr:type IV secretion system protein [Vibrio cholerae]HAS6017043.1 type IV secretion system protein [Vibrio cholerae O1]ELL8242995.1 type IV secretion system protein [Vibrio cholerae]EMA7652474.1 type IV secretion system protein [Vibrio cholerae]MCD6704265.1 type IV secretion system protein [Vibrio cholerae]UIP05447.1 type IV secretion system protein [Vibrio cholerae]